MEDLQIIQSIYQIEHFEQLESINVQPQFTRFRKSSKLEVDPINIIGWTKLVQHQAKIVQIKAFNHENLGSLINELKLIINLNKHTLERIQNCLQEYGIKLIYQAKGEKPC